MEGTRLGDKESMVRVICEITGVSMQALQGRPLSQFSVEERMSWAEERKTKREEDAAYSLLGIFDIYIPLIYGEGRENALRRLRREINESSILPPAPSMEQPRRRRSVSTENRRGKRNAVCDKCSSSQYSLIKVHRADYAVPGGGFGHYAYEDHCEKCIFSRPYFTFETC